jgi:KDO2-lipid IV(A) lauroyltransferase
MAPVPDRSLGLLYRVGWRIGPRIPAAVQRMIISAGAAVAVNRGGRYIRQFAENLRYATGKEPDRDLLRAGIASCLRNFLEVFALPGWSPAKIISRVTTTGEGDLRRAMAGEGAVIALPHSGNWDLAGAWACVTGMPVTTVVEELPGPELTAARHGRLVCLVADRDLLGSGVPVTWNDRPVTMPAGPAVVARRTGAALFPMVSWFTPDGLHLDIGPRIPHRPGRDGLIAMVQDEADYFAARVAEHPQDWHLMQPFFTRSAEPGEGAA